jgi:hypothetical protein
MSNSRASSSHLHDSRSSDHVDISQEPHPDPRLAAQKRILPTPENPSGYPPYEMKEVTSYTNKQLRYYLRTHQIKDVLGFQRAKQRRDEVLASCGANGNTDEEDETPSVHDTQSIMAPASSEYTLDDDGEPDDELPPPIPGSKGLKIDKIRSLKQGGGFLNFRLWLQDLSSAYRADRNRFSTAENRIIFASIHMDDKMAAIWSSAIELMPHLQHHWRKFIRWAEKTHLHGEVDRAKQLQEFNDATQKENEDPNSFYSRLAMLAIAIKRTLTTDDLFPKLLPGLRNVILRNGRVFQSVQELVAVAQQIWGTFSSLGKRRRSEDDKSSQEQGQDAPSQRGGRGGFGLRGRSRGGLRGGSSRGNRGGYRGNFYGPVRDQQNDSNRLSDQEHIRRLANQLCFNCGLANHYSKDCIKPFNPNSPASTSPSSTTDPSHSVQAAGLRRGAGYRRGQARAQPITQDGDQAQEIDTGDDDYFDAENDPDEPLERSEN